MADRAAPRARDGRASRHGQTGTASALTLRCGTCGAAFFEMLALVQHLCAAAAGDPPPAGERGVGGQYRSARAAAIAAGLIVPAGEDEEGAA